LQNHAAGVYAPNDVNASLCQIPSKTRTDERADAGNFGAFQTYSVTSGGNILMIFLIIKWPNVVYLLINRGYLFSIRFLLSFVLRPPIGWKPLTETTDNRQTDQRTCLFVRCPFVSQMQFDARTRALAMALHTEAMLSKNSDLTRRAHSVHDVSRCTSSLHDKNHTHTHTHTHTQLVYSLLF